MNSIIKIIIKIALNALILYLSWRHLPGVVIQGGFSALLAAAALLTVLNVVIKPILHLVTTPLRWLTFGLFSIVIHIAVLAIADLFLESIRIADFTTLIAVALIVAIVNARV